MARLWSLLVLAVLIGGVLTFAIGPTYRMSLPQDVSTHGHTIDGLYYFILALTGIVFIATQSVLFYFMWRYEANTNKDPITYTHGSHTLEIVWTIIPAATLLFISIFQFDSWAEAKMRNPMYGPDGKPGTADDMPPTLEVTARQWEWRLRYPGQDGRLGTADDLFTVNELHVPVNQDIVVSLKSMDILHSFFLPELRVKQDAVPGMKIPVWFQATKTGRYELVCAEHCGARHYAMKGMLVVDTPEDYQAWLRKLTREQFRTQPATTQTNATADNATSNNATSNNAPADSTQLTSANQGEL
ncbi:MAG: cytochrome c oxidase subunit II [Pirellulales bacterium]|nr:cytochrome c oxidase subunit II [Pirellulales bacterium]